MELQISRYFHTEVSATAPVWSGETGVGGSVSPTGCAEGLSDRGGAFAGGSRAHAPIDTAQVCGIKRGGVFEGQERDTRGTAFPEAGKELRGATIVGAGFLCGYGGKERRGDPALHSGTGG